ncbi:MAG: M23 family metallopeptidase [Nitrospirae bacterium]|nr:M23 family metallopeptidase [Nitrospirota bacterium]
MMKSGSKVGKAVSLVLAIGFLLVAGVIAYNIFAARPPVLTGIEAFEKLPVKKDISFKAESNRKIRSIEIVVTQDGNDVTLLKEQPDKPIAEFNITVEPKAQGLNDGQGQVTIKARAGLFAKTIKTFPTAIRSTMPAITVVDSSYITDQGSGLAVLINAKGADKVYIKALDRVYTATNSIYADKNRFFAIIPIDIETVGPPIVTAFAEDAAGNTVTAPVQTIYKPRVYKKDTIVIKDDFIRKHILPLLQKNEGDMPLVDAFLEVNEKWRKDSEAKVSEIAKKTADKILWSGPFVQMKNSKVFAGFGDQRSYIYGDKEVSHSRHMGFDLASLANSPVYASNSGVVAFAGDLGIYGNAVIIDHGLGLMTLYGHLSAIDVKEGAAVEKTTVIGKSGMTGFAAGDHLHFGVLLHGVYVSPVHWWDKRWIDKRVLGVMNSKG